MGLTLGVEEDVRGLEVAVQDAVLVCEVDRAGHGRQQLSDASQKLAVEHASAKRR